MERSSIQDALVIFENPHGVRHVTSLRRMYVSSRPLLLLLLFTCMCSYIHSSPIDDIALFARVAACINPSPCLCILSASRVIPLSRILIAASASILSVTLPALPSSHFLVRSWRLWSLREGRGSTSSGSKPLRRRRYVYMHE